MFFKKALLGNLLLSGLLSVHLAQANSSDISFSQYLDSLKEQAQREGISQDTTDSLFLNIKLFKKALVSQQDQSPPQTLEDYYPSLVPETLVNQSRDLYAEHSIKFEKLGKQYGVQPRFVIALWGLASSLGKDVGDYPLLTVMASNAYRDDQTHSREEFIAAVKVFEKRKLNFDDLKSNWSGKIGYPHFSVGEYDKYAIDGDGDGQIDIWHNLSDAFASTANFLKQSGWNDQVTWGRQVQVPKNIDVASSGLAIKKSFDQWQSLGVRRFNGNDLPNRSDMKASLIMPDGILGRKYLVYDNYRTLVKWNDSPYYALSLTYLSERIKYPAIN
ncbi:lytic murein transglycosylase [Shewanella sp. Isolate11]|uniref:lytic murein transglycosylase n=1 Tax=Shewanella sp. Isolate11 TaxID=2908530 RepID=UPI001EFC2F43|nr:lytic murein transglycosylase [Shewanella sp. Isolate11]MCG9696827.1 lytic murein transglycosylase [Shewanella sp. Isolate11]